MRADSERAAAGDCEFAPPDIEAVLRRARGAIEAMSAAARQLLGEREQNVKDRAPRWRIPLTEELRDPVRCGVAAEGLCCLIEVGGKQKEGRNRPSGRRSITWDALLYAPEPSRREPRRKAERAFVMWLQVALAESGAKVPVTALHSFPGPFAKFAAKCLYLMGAANTGSAGGLAVQLIGDLHKRRRAMQSRSRPPKERGRTALSRMNS